MRGTFAIVLCTFVGCAGDPPDAAPTPAEPVTCGANQVARADGSCASAGVADCGPSAKADGLGGCTPTLAEACGADQLAVLGTTTCAAIGAKASVEPPVCEGKIASATGCRAVDECGAIETDASTVYVDASATPGGDGTASRPFTTITAAVAVATTSIAIAAGTYAETIDTDRPIKLRGRCPSLVTITGSLTLRGDSEVSSLSVTGSGVGITAGKTLLVNRVHVHDTGGIGIRAFGGATELTIRDSLVERATTSAIYGEATKVVVERSHVHGVRPRASDGAYGHGVHVQDDPSGKSSTLTLVDSVIEGAREFGVYVQGSDSSLDKTWIRDTAGRGIHVQFDRVTKHAASVVAREVTVARSVENGIYLYGAAATLRDVRVIGVALEKTGVVGHGLAAVAEDATKAKATVDAERLTVEKVFGAGVLLKGADAKISASVIRDVAARTSDRAHGFGIHVAHDSGVGVASKLELDRSLVERTVAVSVEVERSIASISGSTLRESRAAEAGNAGNALQVANEGEATITASILERNVHAGAVAFGGKLSVTDSLVRGTSGTATDAAFAITAWSGARLSVLRTIVSDNSGYGIHVLGSSADIADCTVRDTKAVGGDLPLGVGIGVQSDTTTFARSVAKLERILVERSSTVGVGVTGSSVEITALLARETASVKGLFGDGLGVARTENNECDVKLTDSLLTHNARGGAVIIGASLSIANTSLTCNRIDLDVEPFHSFAASLTNAGGAFCGCDGGVRACRAQSANLAPAPVR